MSNPYGENQPDQNPYHQPSASPEGQNPYSQPSPYASSGPSGPYDQPGYEQQPGYDQQPGYGAQPAYGVQPAYGQSYGGYAPEHPQGTLVLVFGILGIFFVIFSPIAWYMGNKARKEIAATGVRYSNEQNLNVGRILGMVFSIIYLASLVLVIIFVIIAALGIAASS